MLIECVKNGLIPTPFVKGEVAVSHLLFADDVLIFASDSATAEVAGNLKRFLHDFSIHSGLSTNWGKSSIFFSNCTTDSMAAISSILNIQQRSLPVKYLGLPPFSARLKLDDCQALIDKVRKAPPNGNQSFCP